MKSGQWEGRWEREIEVGLLMMGGLMRRGETRGDSMFGFVLICYMTVGNGLGSSFRNLVSTMHKYNVPSVVREQEDVP